MASNYPPGVTDADPEFWSDYPDLDPTEEDLELEYLDQLEAEAAELPAEWTEEDVAAYEVWLADQPIPRIPPIAARVRIPASLEEAA